MSNKRKLNLMLIVLGVMNLIGGVFHITFEYYLLNNETIYRGFLLIENLLIGLVFIYFSISILFGNWQQRMLTVKNNIFFWFFFIISVIAFQPEITSLNIIKNVLPMPQRYALLVIGITAFILSALSYREVKNENAYIKLHMEKEYK